jgi:predicted nucleotidyltransferase
MPRERVFALLRAALSDLESRFGVRELSVFGSTARDEAGDASDVDVLVDFRGPADFDRFIDLKLEMERLLGRRVDLVTRKALRPQLRAQVEREAVRVA